MKLTKKLLCVMLVVISVLSLCACGAKVDMTDWPTEGLATMLPVPTAGVYESKTDNAGVFSCKIKKVTYEEFTAYVEACKEAGYTVLPSNADKLTDREYRAENTDSTGKIKLYYADADSSYTIQITPLKSK